MKIKFILIALTLFVITNVFSAPIKNFPVQVKQPNGELINCFASGDEFYNWLHDSLGFTIIQSPKNGYYYYAKKSGDSLLASSILYGKKDPASIGIAPNLKTAFSKIKPNIDEYSKHVEKPVLNNKKNDEISVANTGIIQNIVIFIRFDDEEEFSDSFLKYDSLFNTPTGNSLKNYFWEASYNKLTVNSSFYPKPIDDMILSYRDDQPRSYYQPYNDTSNPNGYTTAQRQEREHTLLYRAVNYVSSQIPSSLVIDNDNDGYVDNICFIISGSTTAWSTLLWPHKWSLFSQEAYINGKLVWNYNFQLDEFFKLRGVGVLAHEMFHTLGAPDLYHYSQDDLNPVGQWDLMANTMNPPQHMGAYMKFLYGKWIDSIPQITKSGTYSLNPITSKGNNCYKIASPNSSTEYFVVEYRKNEGMFDASIPGSGLLIYRINSECDGNRNGPFDEVFVYRPEINETNLDGSVVKANYCAEVERTVLNSSTNPIPYLSDGSLGGLDINSIGTCGSTITFTVDLRNIKTNNSAGLSFCGSNSFELPYVATGIYNNDNNFTAQISDRYGNFANPTNIGTSSNNNLSGNITVTIPSTITTGYYYRIRVVSSSPIFNGQDNGENITILNAPIKIKPNNNQMTGTMPVTFSWKEACINNYELQISTNSLFTVPIITKPLYTNTVVISDLAQNTTYYWRLKSFSDSYNSEWSSVWRFTTKASQIQNMLWTCGYNFYAQLGDGSTTDKISPVQVGNEDDWTAISGGYNHSVGIKNNGTMWLWGSNYSENGIGTDNNIPYPAQISNESDWFYVDCGYMSTHAIKNDGTIWSWGYNGLGQLGNGTSYDKYSPTQIGNESDWASVSCGSYHTIAIKNDGTLWGWGYNNDGQLGSGNTITRFFPVKIGNESDWASVSCGSFHTIAIKNDGTLWGWGNNDYGQLGDSSTANHIIPVQIDKNSRWSKVACGEIYTIAIKTNGTLWGWGNNETGQLGNGSTKDTAYPVQIGNDIDWEKVNCGSSHSFAVKKDGTLWGWGYNEIGQLGDGTLENKYFPVRIVTVNKCANVGCGDFHSIILNNIAVDVAEQLINNNDYESVIVYPNPSNNEINVKLDKLFEGEATVQIYNIDGVYIQQYKLMITNNTVGFNINNLPKGKFFAIIKNGIRTKKISFVR